jgi:hypothetical protein
LNAPAGLDSYFALLLIALTSLVTVLVGSRMLGLERGRLTLAALRSLEWIGLVLLFVLLNTGVGTALSLALRSLAPTLFLSPYLSTDITITLLSALQASTFQWWRHTS